MFACGLKASQTQWAKGIYHYMIIWPLALVASRGFDGVSAVHGGRPPQRDVAEPQRGERPVQQRRLPRGGHPMQRGRGRRVHPGKCHLNNPLARSFGQRSFPSSSSGLRGERQAHGRERRQGRLLLLRRLGGDDPLLEPPARLRILQRPLQQHQHQRRWRRRQRRRRWLLGLQWWRIQSGTRAFIHYTWSTQPRPAPSAEEGDFDTRICLVIPVVRRYISGRPGFLFQLFPTVGTD